MKLKSTIPHPQLDPDPNSRLVVIRFSDVRPTRRRWLWPGIIPAGALTILTGDPEQGKSLMTLDWASRVTTGGNWPDGKPNRIGDVLFLTAEDDPNATDIPRFIAAGGDVNRAGFVKANAIDGQPHSPLSLRDDLHHLRELLRTWKDVRLIVIDPLNAYLHGVDTRQDTAVRSVLTPLAELAASFGIAVVAIVHLTKGGGKRAIYRSLGSIGVVGVARAVWMVAPNPDGRKDAKLLLSVKFNIGRRPPGMAYRIVGANGKPSIPVLRFEAFNVALSADEVCKPPSQRREPAEDRALRFLQQVFARASVIPSKELRSRARRDGIAWRTVERVKDCAGIEAFKQGSVWAYRRRSKASPGG